MYDYIEWYTHFFASKFEKTQSVKRKMYFSDFTMEKTLDISSFEV